jgi:RimJ/RimL family protein N-acetyltransferase
MRCEDWVSAEGLKVSDQSYMNDEDLEGTLMKTPITIPGKKIKLRDWQIADVKLFEHWQKPGHAWQDLDGPYYQSQQDESSEMAKKLTLAIQAGDFTSPRMRLAIADMESDQLIGRVASYWESQETNWLCIGITLYDPKFWGKGIGFEALELWIDYLFDARPELVRLDLRTWSGNLGMIALAEKLGFSREACFRKARIVGGKHYDGLGYGILKEEWRVGERPGAK